MAGPDPSRVPLVTRPAAVLYRHSPVGSPEAGRERIDQPALLDLMLHRAGMPMRRASREAPFWKGEQLRSHAESSLPLADSPQATIGRVFGRVLAAFALHLIGESRRAHIDEFFFLARDGYLPMRAYRAIRRAEPDRGALPKGIYLPISRRSSATTHPQLHDALARVGLLTSARPAVVDVGWHGTIQNRIDARLRAGNASAASLGLYLCYSPMRSGHTARTHQLRQGFLADSRRGDWLEHFLFRHFAIFEALLRAPHRTVVDHDASGPLLAAEPDPLPPAVRSIQARALETVHAYRGCAALGIATASDLRLIALEHLRRLLHHPTRSEAELLSSLSHDEPLLDPPPFERIGGIPLKGDSLESQLERNYWPPGMLRMSGRPLACLSREIEHAHRAGEGDWI
ncbi:MAG: hypothetical protein AAGG07_13665 [Planctomycetota bacterium]